MIVSATMPTKVSASRTSVKLRFCTVHHRGARVAFISYLHYDRTLHSMNLFVKSSTPLLRPQLLPSRRASS
jgi:hypothetical protein